MTTMTKMTMMITVITIMDMIIMITMMTTTSVVDMAGKSDVLPNLDPEVLRLRVEIGCALQ